MVKGGLIHKIKDDKLALSRNIKSIPKKAQELVEYLCFKNNEFISRNTYNIYGSFNYRLQEFPSDIDSTNIIYIDLDDDIASKMIETELQKIARKLKNNEIGRTYVDMKCGEYHNGESIHWTIDETINGIRDKKKPDINGQFSNRNITLYDAINMKHSIIKMDMISPYMGRYVEVSCLYQIKTHDGYITHTNIGTSQTNFLNNLSKDTYKQHMNNKIFKTVKRIYSNAKIRNDIPVLKTVSKLIDSNLSKLASYKADISTILLLLSVHKFPSIVVLKQQFSKMKFGLDNILDIKLPLDKIYDIIDHIYILLSKKDIQAVLLLKQLENIFDKIINKQTIDYFDSININNIPEYFGKKYFKK